MWLVGIPLIAYLAVLAYLYVFQRQLLYFPDRSRPQLGFLAHQGVREVSLTTADGLSLLSWYLPPREGRPVILYFHGNGGNIGYRAARIERFGGEGYGVQRKWSNKFEGAYEFLYGTTGLALVAPGVSLQDINDDFEGQILADVLVPQTRSIGMAELGLEFSLPMFVFEGDEDFTTPTALARQYVESMKAPHKEFVPIHGGHFAMFMHSDEFLQELVKRVRPWAVGN